MSKATELLVRICKELAQRTRSEEVHPTISSVTLTLRGGTVVVNVVERKERLVTEVVVGLGFVPTVFQRKNLERHVQEVVAFIDLATAWEAAKK